MNAAITANRNGKCKEKERKEFIATKRFINITILIYNRKTKLNLVSVG